MATECFIPREFKNDTLAIIAQANRIIADYQRRGFTLTLRQLYYQFVSRALIANTQREYKRLGDILNNARLAGLVDWGAIEDRLRNVEKLSSWDSPAEIIAAVARQYREDLWAAGQNWRPEVWIEKDALVGVIERVCNRWRVPYLACRGYVSQSEQYDAGKRFASVMRDGVKPIVFHLGDHDPSGVDMTRDNTDRLAMFAREDIEVRRLALNRDQVDRYDPPPNPVKDTDSRSTGYNDEHGDECWELDALDPAVIEGLVEEAILSVLDRPAWDRAAAAEAERRQLLQDTSDQWADVVDFLNKEEGDEG